MNAFRARRLKQARERAARAAAAATAVATVIGLISGSFAFGVFAGGLLAVGGVMRALEGMRELPPMLEEYRNEHLELRRIGDQLETRLRLLPEAVEQVKDVLELDAVVRSAASASVRRVRELHDRAVREGRVGVMDKVKGGLRTAAGLDAINELTYMFHTVQSVLAREIGQLESEVALDRDAARRQSKQLTLSALKTQHGALGEQLKALRERLETMRHTRESLRAVELQLAATVEPDVQRLEAMGRELLSNLNFQATALEKVLGELDGRGERPALEDRKRQ